MRRIVISVLTILALLAGLCACAEGSDTSGVADASQMTDVVEVVEPGMVPVTADALLDGTYEVTLVSSSAMFKVTRCELIVAEGSLTAVLHMKSDAYAYMYPGTAEEAAAAPAEALIPLEDMGGDLCFNLPVEALDAGITCAAFSQRKAVWYPRTLLLRSDSLPMEAWSEEGSVTAASLGLEDGVYTVEAVLEGGRISVENPVTLEVQDGQCTAQIVLSSQKVGYVMMDGARIDAVDGAYTVPVAAFDRKLTLVINSTAIKPATDVDYTLCFDSATIAPAP